MLELKLRDRLPSYLGDYLRWAALLRTASLPAVGIVACEAVQPETVAYARESRVRVWADGVLIVERPPGSSR